MVQDTREFRYVIDGNDCFLSANGEWFDFARENGAGHLTLERLLGRSVWDFIAGRETRQLYRVLLKGVREGRSITRVPYRCDSPNRRRYMELGISRNADGSVVFCSWLVGQEEREAVALLDQGVSRNEELIAMCSWCNKVRVGEVDWVEAEEAVRVLGLFNAPALPQISHGMCGECAGRFSGF